MLPSADVATPRCQRLTLVASGDDLELLLGLAAGIPSTYNGPGRHCSLSLAHSPYFAAGGNLYLKPLLRQKESWAGRHMRQGAPYSLTGSTILTGCGASTEPHQEAPECRTKNTALELAPLLPDLQKPSFRHIPFPPMDRISKTTSFAQGKQGSKGSGAQA